MAANLTAAAPATTIATPAGVSGDSSADNGNRGERNDANQLRHKPVPPKVGTGILAALSKVVTSEIRIPGPPE